MKYYLINYVPPSKNNYCFCMGVPEGPYFPYYYMIEGKAVSQSYPEDPYSVVLKLDEDWPSLRLGSFIGNTGSLLIFHKKVAKYFMDAFNTKEIETLSFTILNHKGRIHSKDFVFFNPIGSLDCVDYDLTEFKYKRKTGEIRGIRKMVLDNNKLSNAPDIFRVPESPNIVLFSQKILDAVAEQGYTNFEFMETNKNDQINKGRV